MLAKLFKAFVGDKTATDMKEVQPVVDQVKAVEPTLANLTADELRQRSSALRDEYVRRPRSSWAFMRCRMRG